MEADPIIRPNTPATDTVGLLDFCKGVAIVWIVLVHILHGWFGWQGVHVFIILGGFTLAHASLNREQQLTWKQWFLKRALRILPAYWLVATAGFYPIRDEGNAYAEKLSAAGVKTDLRQYDDMIHGFFSQVTAGRRGPKYNREIAAAVAAAIEDR